MILSSPSSFKLNNIILWGWCKNVVSLSVEIVHYLTVYPSGFVINTWIKLETIELVIFNDPFLIQGKLSLKKLQVCGWSINYPTSLCQPFGLVKSFINLVDSFCPKQRSVSKLALTHLIKFFLVGNHSDRLSKLLELHVDDSPKQILFFLLVFWP